MRVKIKQPELIGVPEVKQLPTKQIFTFKIKRQNKFLSIPVNISILEITPTYSEEFAFNINFFKNGFTNTSRYKIQQMRSSIETEELPLPPQ